MNTTMVVISSLVRSVYNYLELTLDHLSAAVWTIFLATNSGFPNAELQISMISGDSMKSQTPSEAKTSTLSDEFICLIWISG